MFGGSDAFAASEIIPLRCFLEASRNRDRNVFRTSTTPCEGSDVLDIMRKVCWWLWWLKCDVGQTGTPVSIMGSRGIRWVNRSFVQPSHISDTTEHGQSLLILGQPISKLAAKSASPDRRRFSTGLYLNRRRLSIMRWVSLLGL